ncbi:MAG: nitrogenase component 1 [Azoarcus sp.]|jgi:nitrogenase molybdenum-iron protein alpha chain|nr:nitrogenase component 1 [Azoarcus sp.]
MTTTSYAERNALTRERRRGALSHYHGTLASLIDDCAGDEIPQRVRTLTQATHDDILAALTVLRGLRDVAIVVHGASGCAAAAVTLAEEGRARWYSVNLSERDSILGSEEPLRETILRAVAEGAAAVFVVGTPVVAINNDDVNAVLRELSGETDVPLLYVNTDGFTSKTALTGFDIAFHALLRLVDAPRETTGAGGGFLNLLAVRQNARDLAAVTGALAALGIRWNLLPRHAPLENIRRAAGARATVSLNQDESDYFGLALEDRFGTPRLRLPAPIGLAGTRAFITGLGAAFSVDDKAGAYIEVREEALLDLLVTRPLSGKRVFLQTDLAQAVGLAGLVGDLGGELAGLALTAVDLDSRAQLARLDAADDVPVIVADGQPFEIANVLARTPVDYYIGAGQVAFAAHFGAMPISLHQGAFYAYEGIQALAAAVARPWPDIRERARHPYSKSWLRKTGSWHVKREVR